MAPPSSKLPKRNFGMNRNKQASALNSIFEVSLVVDRLSDTPLIYQFVYRDVRRAIIHRFPYLVWFRVIGETVTVLACTHGRQDPKTLKARF